MFNAWEPRCVDLAAMATTECHTPNLASLIDLESIGNCGRDVPAVKVVLVKDMERLNISS